MHPADHSGADDQTEYVIAPWGTSTCSTEIRTVHLPARDVVAQLEVPSEVVDTSRTYAERHDITLERALAERLERNRARVSLLAARSVEDAEAVHEHLNDALEALSGVDHIDTEALERDIESVWYATLRDDEFS